jgi:hypothetical protein
MSFIDYCHILVQKLVNVEIINTTFVNLNSLNAHQPKFHKTVANASLYELKEFQ